MTYPDTSLTISRTNAVRLLKWPLVRDMRDDSRGVVFCPEHNSVSEYVSELAKGQEHGSITEDERMRQNIHGLY